MQLLQLVFGKRKGYPFSLLVFIAPISVLGCLRVVLPYHCSSLSYPRTGFPPSQGLSRVNRFGPLNFI
jgi:hypothetical protein